jgi:hypothetical protein
MRHIWKKSCVGGTKQIQGSILYTPNIPCKNYKSGFRYSPTTPRRYTIPKEWIKNPNLTLL